MKGLTTMSEIKENKMGVLPINKLLFSMSLPMIISMLVQALYNVVDSIFVAKLSENALTAVSLAFPMQNFMIAVSVGTGVGMNAYLSRSLGEKNFENANKAAVNGLFLATMSSLLFVLIGIFFTKFFFSFQTKDKELIKDGVEYLSICCVLSIGLFGQVTLERLLQSTGKTVLSMIAQLVGAVTNIIFDPIMIFGLLGFPALGIKGAAIATVFGQTVASIVALFLNIKYNKEINLSLKGFRPNGYIIKRIYSVGIPSIVMASITSVMTFFMNKILIAFTATATAVLGVYFKLQSFIFMPVFGLNNGMVPIVSYNYGAAKVDRIIKTIKLSIKTAVTIMLIGFATFQFIPDKLLMMFNASGQMLEIGIPALRTISYSFIFAGFCIITTSVFQSLGQGFLSLMVSVIRQLIVLLPAAYFLSLTGKLNAVWFAFPIAEIFSVILCTIFIKHTYNKILKPLKKQL